MTRDNNVTIEGAQIIFRNFAGKEQQYNREGDRNFAILLEPETAQIMEDAGWNVKKLSARDEDEGAEDRPYIQVSVSYRTKPPRIVLLSPRMDGSMSRTPVDEAMISMLDYVEIENCDVVLNPYDWVVGGKSGVKAYLKTMFITIKADRLEMKYNNIEEGNVSE